MVAMKKQKIFFIAILGLTLTAGIWLIISGKDALEEKRHRESKKAHLEKDIEEFRKESKKTRQHLERLRKDPEFQEATARQELGYGKEGERVYRFPKEKE